MEHECPLQLLSMKKLQTLHGKTKRRHNKPLTFIALTLQHSGLSIKYNRLQSFHYLHIIPPTPVNIRCLHTS
jgi:hypothetical protein